VHLKKRKLLKFLGTKADLQKCSCSLISFSKGSKGINSEIGTNLASKHSILKKDSGAKQVIFRRTG
jgi:hypothetical protein